MPSSKVIVFRRGMPASNFKVTLEYSGLTQMGFTTPTYTDESGVAHINHRSTGKAMIYVDGMSRKTMLTPGTEKIYLK